MKRIFIAVGSEALKGLTSLVRRLCEENLFSQFDDRYIAIDSMVSQVAAFNALGERLNTDRVKGFTLNIRDDDEAVRESFQPGWTVKTVPAGGVGGDRTISAKAVAFLKEFWDDANMHLGTDLKSRDQIVVIGTAFGGTSGGLFMNVCDFIDLQIRGKRDEDDDFKNVQVLGFLLMPEPAAAKGSYPIAVNMITLFKELQVASWRRRLEAERPGFKVPVPAQRERSGDGDVFPLFTRAAAGAHQIAEVGVQGSSLPVSTLYVVPTPVGRRSYATSILAEQLFAASYLRIDEGHGAWVDRHVAGQLGPDYDVGAEDPCFAGFNMFVMKSGRMVSLKNWFYEKLIGVLEGNGGRPGFLNGAADHPVIPENVKEVFLDAQMPHRDEPLAGIDVEQCSALKALLAGEKDAILNPRALSEFQSDLKGLLASVRSSVPSYEVVPAKELIVLLAADKYSNWNTELNLDLIEKGYESFHSEISLQASNVDAYAEQLEKALGNAIRYVKARVKNRVVRNWVFGLSQEDAVFREIATAFDQKFKALLKCYVYACRCARSPFMGVGVFAKEAGEFRKACEQLKNCLEEKRKNLRGGSNPYVIEGKLKPLKDLPPEEERKIAFTPFKSALFVAYRACVGDTSLNIKTIRDLQDLGDEAEELNPAEATSDAILEAVEEGVVNRYLDVTSKLQPGVNPLSDATVADYADVKGTGQGCMSHAKELKVKDSGTFHYHFVVKQGKFPDGFHMTNSDVQSDQSGLGFTTMPNTANGATAFLSANHGVGAIDSNYWKDENTAKSPVFEGSKDKASLLPVQGLWIGTLGIDFKAHDILERLYAANNVKREWVRTELNTQTARSAMTLSEMVRFGLVIEAIEKSVNEAWRRHKATSAAETDKVRDNTSAIRVSFESAGRSFELCSGKLSDFGFADNDDGTCQLRQISVALTGKILGWIRSHDLNGFAAFYPMAKFASIRNCETDIFEDLRFSIKPEEIKEMDQVRDIIANTVKVVGL